LTYSVSDATVPLVVDHYYGLEVSAERKFKAAASLGTELVDPIQISDARKLYNLFDAGSFMSKNKFKDLSTLNELINGTFNFQLGNYSENYIHDVIEFNSNQN